MKRLQKQGYATKDIDSRRYVITSHGEQHLDKLGVVKHILSSDYWIPDFLWSPTSKEPAMEVYNMVQGKEMANNALPFLKARLQTTKLMDLEQLKNDLINYAIKMGLVKEKSDLRNVWKEIFKRSGKGDCC